MDGVTRNAKGGCLHKRKSRLFSAAIKMIERDEEIRRLYIEEKLSQPQIGARFGICRSAVSRIVNGNRHTKFIVKPIDRKKIEQAKIYHQTYNRGGRPKTTKSFQDKK